MQTIDTTKAAKYPVAVKNRTSNTAEKNEHQEEEKLEGIKSYIPNNKNNIPCTCRKKTLFANKNTGVVTSACSREWDCKRRNVWAEKVKHIDFDHFLTVTTRHEFKSSAPILRAQTAKQRFLAALRYRQPQIAYICAMGITHNSNRIHYHLLVNGSIPTKKKLRSMWHKLTGCTQIKIRRAEKSDIYYLFNNAIQLPNIYDDSRFSIADVCHLAGFRRIVASRNLFPKRVKIPSADYAYAGLDYRD